jgi:Tfp pilus assembly protein PilN
MTQAILQDQKQDDAMVAPASPKPRAAREKPRSGILLDIPGADSGAWDRWSCPEGGEAERLTPGEAAPARFRRAVALPSGFIFTWPLWISPEGDARELARLELSGRHLLKRGMEESLTTILLDNSSGRRLVLAVAPEEPLPEEMLPAGWREADAFLLTPRLKAPADGCDLIFWREHGTLRGAFFRQGYPVWCFLADRGALAGLLRRASLKLISEGILSSSPRRIALVGLAREEAQSLRTTLSNLYPGAAILEVAGDSIPSITPGGPLSEDLLPGEARAARVRAKTKERLVSIGAVAAALYLLVILWCAGDLMIRHSVLSKLRSEVAKLEAPASKARKVSERWNALRSAVDPATFPLDQLAAIAAPTAGGKVRLISVTMENGHLQISGEATDVTQAYGFMESLKKSPILQQYDWTSGQPQLAGKNSVKFDMEGARAHANP